jgi:hypothetical protein
MPPGCRTRNRSGQHRRAPARRGRNRTEVPSSAARRRSARARCSAAGAARYRGRRDSRRRSRMRSSMAQVEPLPLVPATRITGQVSRWPSRALIAATRSSPSSMPALPRGCSASRCASQASSPASAAIAASRGRDALQQGEQRGQFVAQFAAIDDHVDGALFEQEFARWKPSGKVSRTVCSITRGPAKPIRAPGSAITTSPTKGEGSRNATHGRVGQQRNEGQLVMRSCVTAAVVLAICIRENRPSCMRAPPEAVMQMKATAIRSPP